MVNRVVIYGNTGDFDRAIRRLSTEAIRINPNFADAYNNRGAGLLHDKGDFDHAIEDYTKAIGPESQCMPMPIAIVGVLTLTKAILTVPL